MSKDLYDIHGVPTCIYTDDPLWSKISRRMLAHFPPPPPGRTAQISLRLSLVGSTFPVLDPATHGDLVYESPSARCIRSRETLTFYLEEKSLVAVDLNQPAAVVYLKEETALSERRFTNFVFYIVLQELLKRFGLFHVHAACLAKEGRGLLLVGKSRTGKSTLALNLVQAGLDFLSDDVTFVRRSDRQPTLLPLSQAISLRRDSLRLFPELESRMSLSGAEKPKTSFSMHDLYPHRVTASCRSSTIIFLRLNDGRHTIERVDAPEALANIVCYSLILLAERTGREHLEVLRDLVQKSQCYDLNISEENRDDSEVTEACLSLL